MAAQVAGKDVVRRFIEEVMNQGRLEVIDEIYSDRLAHAARRWVEPFLTSFVDVDMRVVDLVAEGEKVVGRFLCSGTHAATWQGHPPTGRRFTNIDEVAIFTVREGRIVEAWSLEDTWSRLRQLGLGSDDAG